jgi:hypothetical protein
MLGLGSDFLQKASLAKDPVEIVAMAFILKQQKIITALIQRLS